MIILRFIKDLVLQPINIYLLNLYGYKCFKMLSTVYPTIKTYPSYAPAPVSKVRA